MPTKMAPYQIELEFIVAIIPAPAMPAPSNALRTPAPLFTLTDGFRWASMALIRAFLFAFTAI